MYVSEHLARAVNPLFSYEIIPPQRGKSAREIFDVVEQIVPFDPPFIDVTARSAEAVYEERDDGTFRRRVRRKRPGTISICGIIQNRYKVDTVPHLLCRGFTKEETEDVLIELNYLGIHNVLAVRGDETNYKKQVIDGRTTNDFAIDLVRQVSDLKGGVYLEDMEGTEPVHFCIGVGGYPEKHVEAPNMKSDIARLKEKVDAGADYVVTQMFFNNQDYFSFIKLCREAGISAPIIPGIKILSSYRHLKSLPKNFLVTLPDELVDEVEANRKHAAEVGVRWAIRQVRELLDAGTMYIHFYIMNDARAVTKVIKGL